MDKKYFDDLINSFRFNPLESCLRAENMDSLISIIAKRNQEIIETFKHNGETGRHYLYGVIINEAGENLDRRLTSISRCLTNYKYEEVNPDRRRKAALILGEIALQSKQKIIDSIKDQFIYLQIEVELDSITSKIYEHYLNRFPGRKAQLPTELEPMFI